MHADFFILVIKTTTPTFRRIRTHIHFYFKKVHLNNNAYTHTHTHSFVRSFTYPQCADSRRLRKVRSASRSLGARITSARCLLHRQKCSARHCRSCCGSLAPPRVNTRRSIAFASFCRCVVFVYSHFAAAAYDTFSKAFLTLIAIIKSGISR